MDKIEEKKKVIEIFDKMRLATPDGCSVLQVLQAAELIIADCIAQSFRGEKIADSVFANIAADIRLNARIISRKLNNVEYDA